MDNKVKYSMIFGNSLVSLVFGFTNPVVMIYFTARIDPSIFALSNMLSLGIRAIISNSINFDRIMGLYKRYFLYIVLLDIIGCGIIYIFSVDYVSFRYISMAILNAISTNLWEVIMKNAINNTIGGDDLTKFNASIDAFDLWASMIGCSLVLILGNEVISINGCLVLQWFVILTMGIIDIHNYKKLTNKINRD